MPVLARVYGITPREQAELTLSEFRALQLDHQQQQREAEGVS